jgi:ATP-dependent Lon protease
METWPDLNYRQMKAIITFQQFYRNKRQLANFLNNSLEVIYQSLVSASNNIITNYNNKIITEDNYYLYMSRVESLAKKYRNIEKPVTIRTCMDANTRYHISYLHFEITDLVKATGAFQCYDILRLFGGGDWDLEFSLPDIKLLQILNSMFIPVSVKTTKSKPEGGIKIFKTMLGADICLSIRGVPFTIAGYFKSDPLNISHDALKIKELTEKAITKYDNHPLITNLIDNISLRDILCSDMTTLLVMIGNDIRELERIRKKQKVEVIEEFHLATPGKQFVMLSLLLLDNRELAFTIIKNMPKYCEPLFSLLPWKSQQIYEKAKLTKEDDNMPYDVRIDNLKCSDAIKRKAREKLKEIRTSKEGNEKALRYLEGLLRIPFGIYRKEPILNAMNSLAVHQEGDSPDRLLATDREREFKNERKQYLTNVKATLDACIYGQREAKRHIESVIAQWINGEMGGVVFGFQGYPGTGKTTLAKQGIAKCLVDGEGNTRPFYFTSLGGSNGASFLLGHGYTYVGSQQGKLAEYVQDAKIMNPILYFDELDKVSNTPQGEEIIRVLTHLLDPEQNDHIEDRYFGVEMDLSKAIIILSYNDSSVIDGILMDRIHEINFKQYNLSDKVNIAKKYVLPKIMKAHGFAIDDFIISDELYSYIIDSYTCEAGVRGMKDKLTDIVREINLRRIYDEDQYALPITLTSGLVDDILVVKNKIHFKMVNPISQVGLVNGLFATSIGTGGITVIEVYDTPSDQKYALELTGKLGDVMKESVACAKTNSWAMLKGTPYYESVNTTWRENAIHIHFPAAGTSKDGPSAGAAITTAIVSYFSKLPFKQDHAMTGEIDLHGNICPIGGLQSKIEGAQKAGVKVVLIPRRNEEEYLTFKDNYNIKVIAVDNISQVIRLCLEGATDTSFNYQHPTSQVVK